MTRPKKSDSKRTAGEILPAAEREFGTKGFDAARLEDMAWAAGISRPSLLYHYSSKEALYEAVVRAAFGDLAARLSGVLAQPGPPREAVGAVVREFRAFLEERPGLSRLLVRELVSENGPGRKVLLDEIVPLLDLVEEGLTALRGQRSGLPVREAVATMAASLLLRRASRDLGERLWGLEDRSEHLAEALILGEMVTPEVKS